MCSIVKTSFPQLIDSEAAALFVVDLQRQDMWTPVGDITLGDGGGGFLSPMARPSAAAQASSSSTPSAAAAGAVPAEVRLPLGTGLVGHAATTATSVAVPEAYEDPRFDPCEKLTTKLRTVMCVPIRRSDGSVLGVVQASNKQAGGAFSADDEQLIQAIRYGCVIAGTTTCCHSCMSSLAVHTCTTARGVLCSRYGTRC